MHAGTLTCCARSFFFCSTLMARTLEPCAILDSAIMGHRIVLCAGVFKSCESIAFVIWCRPVITSGAYRRPNTAANKNLKSDVSPAYTTSPIAFPIVQPIGPTTMCAMNTAGTNEQNGTTIILITSGHIFLKNFSRYTRTNPAIIAAMTCP